MFRAASPVGSSAALDRCGRCSRRSRDCRTRLDPAGADLNRAPGKQQSEIGTVSAYFNLFFPGSSLNEDWVFRRTENGPRCSRKPHSSRMADNRNATDVRVFKTGRTLISEGNIYGEELDRPSRVG